MSTQGYLIIAVGQLRYLQMAYFCALSIRHWDANRSIQLVTDLDESHHPIFGGVFTHITCIDVPISERGPILKLNVFEYSLFDETLFVDADCLVVSPLIEDYWEYIIGRYDFGVPGQIKRSGQWYKTNIEDMCRLAGVKHLVKINSGAYFFNRSATAKAVFAEALALYREYGNIAPNRHRGTSAPDEPPLALALGKVGIRPMSRLPGNDVYFMLSLLNGRECDGDAFGGGFRFLKGDKQVSVVIAHFVSGNPADVYHRLIEAFVDRYNPDFWSAIPESEHFRPQSTAAVSIPYTNRR